MKGGKEGNDAKIQQAKRQLAKAEDELILARLEIDLYNAEQDKRKGNGNEQQSKHVESLKSQINAIRDKLGKGKGGSAGSPVKIQ